MSDLLTSTPGSRQTPDRGAVSKVGGVSSVQRLVSASLEEHDAGATMPVPIKETESLRSALQVQQFPSGGGLVHMDERSTVQAPNGIIVDSVTRFPTVDAARDDATLARSVDGGGSATIARLRMNQVARLQQDKTLASTQVPSSEEPLLELRHVFFRYPSRPESRVLDDFNLTLRKGEVVALVGTSGGGKSSVIKLLSRLYEPSMGAVELAGRPLADYEPQWLHGRAVAVVSQEPTLFGGRTVWQQILYALDVPTEESCGGRRALYGPPDGVAWPSYVHLGVAEPGVAKPAENVKSKRNGWCAWRRPRNLRRTGPMGFAEIDGSGEDLEAHLLAKTEADARTTTASFAPSDRGGMWSPVAYPPGSVCYDVHRLDNTGAIIRAAAARAALVAEYAAGLKRARRELVVKRKVMLARSVASNANSGSNCVVGAVATPEAALAALAPHSTFNEGVPRRTRSVLLAAARKRARKAARDEAEAAALTRLGSRHASATGNGATPSASWPEGVDSNSPSRALREPALLRMAKAAVAADTAAAAVRADIRRIRRMRRMREWVRAERAGSAQKLRSQDSCVDDELAALLEAWSGTANQQMQQSNLIRSGDAATTDGCSDDDDGSIGSDASSEDDDSDAGSDAPRDGLRQHDARFDLPPPTPTPAVMRRVLSAARAAHAVDFVRQLPDGFDTVIGAKGSTLSGGQKQRLALARALARDPAVLLIDEGTSALDGASEAAAMAGIASVMEGRCVLTVAHRLSTVRGADRICVVANGRIVEEGCHDELVARSGAYATLVAQQLMPAHL